MLGGGVSLVPPLPVPGSLCELQHPGQTRGSKFSVSGVVSLRVQTRRGGGLACVPKAPRGAVVWGSCADAGPAPCSQAALLLSVLWMPALLPVASRLLLLPRALLSMASGSPPSQPSTASGSAYVPGSVSAAFVTCPNEKVAKEIARWGDLGNVTSQGEAGARGRVPPLRMALGAAGRPRSDGAPASPSGRW